MLRPPLHAASTVALGVFLMSACHDGSSVETEDLSARLTALEQRVTELEEDKATLETRLEGLASESWVEAKGYTTQGAVEAWVD
ncbi:MAG TPA: hypothetical protein PK095_13140, partial [Myxococcota bacterium]|nr:hypothetical protein [Myxococcota bacterium]